MDPTDINGMGSLLEQFSLALIFVVMVGGLLVCSRHLRSNLTNFLPLAIALVASIAIVYQISSMVVWLPILGAVAVFVTAPTPVVKGLKQ